MFYKPARNFFIIIIIFTNICFADGLLEDDFFNGFSGRLEVCMFSVATNSNIIPFVEDEYDFVNEENTRNSELEKNSEFTIAANLSILFNLEYSFESGTLFYVGTHFYDDSREGLVFGIEKELNPFIMDLSIFGDVNDVWQNPYITDSDRIFTSEYIAGVDLNFYQIMNSGLNAGIKSKFKYVEDDVIGDQEEDLKRSGFVNTATLEYDSLFERDGEKIPNNILLKLGYTRADLDGESSSYESVLIGLKGTFWYEKISFGLTSIYEGRKYGKSHPLFNKLREDQLLTNGLMVTFHDLGKSKKWYVTGIMSVSNVFSNIDFYSSDTYMVFSSIGYNF